MCQIHLRRKNFLESNMIYSTKLQIQPLRYARTTQAYLTTLGNGETHHHINCPTPSLSLQ